MDSDSVKSPAHTPVSCKPLYALINDRSFISCISLLLCSTQQPPSYSPRGGELLKEKEPCSLRIFQAITRMYTPLRLAVDKCISVSIYNVASLFVFSYTA